MEKKASELEENKRLDEVLALWGAARSRSKVKSLFDSGSVTVNGKKENAHYRLRVGDIVNYQEYTEKPLDIVGEDIPLDVIYEDDCLLIINKPAGLVVHPGNGHSSGTLVNGLVNRLSSLPTSGGSYRPGLVHRIDKDTSGLLAVAKNELAFESLSKQLSTHSMHREYLALVKGIIEEDDAKIDAPIGRDILRPTKFAVNGRDKKEAITYFHVEKRYPNASMSLISCRLFTGRTHQIRVHLDYIGHPLIGDPLYGEGNKALYDKGQLLHAYRLTLVHPSTLKEMSFEAPLPAYFSEFIKNLD